MGRSLSKFEHEVEYWEPFKEAELCDDVESVTMEDEVDTAFPVQLVPKLLRFKVP